MKCQWLTFFFLQKKVDAAEAQKQMEQKNTMETYHLLKAFDLALKYPNLLSSFNKIYKFDQNFASLQVKMDEFAAKTSGMNLVKVVNELKVNHLYRIDYEPVCFCCCCWSLNDFI